MKTGTLNAVLALVAICIVLTVINAAVQYLTQDYTTETALLSVGSDSELVQGVFIRDEKVISYSGKGVISYEVSDGGNVRSAGREVPHRFGTLFKKSQILRTPVQSNKRTVVLRENGRIHLHFVDRLIAAAFIPNPGHATRVRHLDGDSMNDRADNLAWVEPGASGKNGRVKRKLGKRERAIPVIVEDGNGNRALLSTTLKCVRLLGISVHYVRRVVAGKDATIAGLRIRRAVREDLSAMTPDKQEDLAPLREWTRGRPRVPPRRLVVATPPSGPAFLLPSAKEAARAAGVPLSTMYQILQGVFPSPAGWTFRRATEADMELWRPTEDGPCGS